jgi:hypothetical protein
MAMLAVVGSLFLGSRLVSNRSGSVVMACVVALSLPLGMNAWLVLHTGEAAVDPDRVAGTFQRLTFMVSVAVVLGLSHLAILVGYFKARARLSSLQARQRLSSVVWVVGCISVGVAAGAGEGALVLWPRASAHTSSGAAYGALAAGLASLFLVGWHGVNSLRHRRGQGRAASGSDRPRRDDDDAIGAGVPMPRPPPGLSGRAVLRPPA